MINANSGTPSLLPRRPRRRERLEFALPTINIIFLMMLYFLFAGTLVQRKEMSVVPPVTDQRADERLPRPLLLVTETGGYDLDGMPVGPDGLLTAGSAVLKKTGADRLNILAPATMDAGPFLALVAEFSAAGIPVRLVTIEREDTPAKTR